MLLLLLCATVRFESASARNTPTYDLIQPHPANMRQYDRGSLFKDPVSPSTAFANKLTANTQRVPPVSRLHRPGDSHGAPSSAFVFLSHKATLETYGRYLRTPLDRASHSDHRLALRRRHPQRFASLVGRPRACAGFLARRHSIIRLSNTSHCTLGQTGSLTASFPNPGSMTSAVEGSKTATHPEDGTERGLLRR